MKLDMDCVRDVLLEMEAMEYGESLHINQLAEKPSLSKYSENEVQYTCLKLKEAGFIEALTIHALRAPLQIVDVSDITYAGHEFLNTIRENQNWEKVKTTAKKAGVYSLKGLLEISQKVAAAAIAQALQLNL